MNSEITSIHQKPATLISIIIVTYNSSDHIKECLESVGGLNYANYETIVIDNCSTDNTVKIIKNNFPGVKIIQPQENTGFAGGNNLGASHASGEILAFLNPDTIVDPCWLTTLSAPLIGETPVGVATSKILLLDEPQLVNTCGNHVHFTGMPSCRGWRMPADFFNKETDVCSVSGAAFAIRKNVFEKIKGFDENFFLYAEDTDLSLRVWLAGYHCLFIPESIAYHDYHTAFNPQKIFYLERNRYQILLKNFRWKTLLVLLPGLLLTEIVVILYSLLRGPRFFTKKIETFVWLIKNFHTIMAERKQVQQIRVALDADVLKRSSSHLEFSLAYGGFMVKSATTLINSFFALLHRLVVMIVIW